MSRTAVFSHGKESGPWGSKIVALADVARSEGWRVESVDYQGLDDPADRVAKLLGCAPSFGPAPLLIGSSMGGHVAAAASTDVRAGGLFLMAPAFFMPGYEHLTPVPAACPTVVVHGWHDEIVPVDHSIRWARQYGATLHVLNSDHRLLDQLEPMGSLFRHFLRRLETGSRAP